MALNLEEARKSIENYINHEKTSDVKVKMIPINIVLYLLY